MHKIRRIGTWAALAALIIQTLLPLAAAAAIAHAPQGITLSFCTAQGLVQTTVSGIDDKHSPLHGQPQPADHNCKLCCTSLHASGLLPTATAAFSAVETAVTQDIAQPASPPLSLCHKAAAPRAPPVTA